MKNQENIIINAVLFFIAMAFLESAVVIYLRELLYPNGFKFPLEPMKEIIIITELVREFATIVMLWTVGCLAGWNKSTRFAWFLIGFGIWDIFYYVFLYVFLQWPALLLEWDILFLIPIPWYGPVIAPCIISVLMILFGVMIIHFNNRKQNLKFSLGSMAAILLGCGITLYTFMADFANTMAIDMSCTNSDDIMLHSQVYIPTEYPYWIFGSAAGLIIVGLISFWKSNQSVTHITSE